MNGHAGSTRAVKSFGTWVRARVSETLADTIESAGLYQCRNQSLLRGMRNSCPSTLRLHAAAAQLDRVARDLLFRAPGQSFMFHCPWLDCAGITGGFSRGVSRCLRLQLGQQICTTATATCERPSSHGILQTYDSPESPVRASMPGRQ